MWRAIESVECWARNRDSSGLNLPFATVSKFGHFRSLHDVGPQSYRCTGRGSVDPPNLGRYTTFIRAKDNIFIRAKDNTFVRLTVSPNETPESIHLPEIHFGWGNKGDVQRVLLYDLGSAIVFFHWWGRVTNNLHSPFGQNSV